MCEHRERLLVRERVLEKKREPASALIVSYPHTDDVPEFMRALKKRKGGGNVSPRSKPKEEYVCVCMCVWTSAHDARLDT